MCLHFYFILSKVQYGERRKASDVTALYLTDLIVTNIQLLINNNNKLLTTETMTFIYLFIYKAIHAMHLALVE